MVQTSTVVYNTTNKPANLLGGPEMGRSGKCHLFLLALLLFSASRPLVCDDWGQSLVLDNDGKYVVHWSLGNDETIKFVVEVETQGYVGFGLSITGGMAGSDIVTGRIDNGIDRYGLGNFIPEIDDSQDWELLSGSKNETHTVLTFQRQLNTCDKEQDVVIDRNRIRLIYAYSEDVPKSPEGLQYHQWRRGIKSAGLLEQPTADVPAEKEIYYWDALSSNLTLTSEIKSLYWCTIVKGPELDTKHHVIKFEPITTPGGKRYLHHVFIYECTDSDVSPEKYEFFKAGSYACSTRIMHDELKTCLPLLAGLGVGAEEFAHLKHTGRPLKARPPKYYRLEVHYENPSGADSVSVQSGMRLWYTPELRKYDVGEIRIGAGISPLMVIPPAQNSYVIAGHGYSDCSASGLPPGGVNITDVKLHAHVLGRQITVRHFREKKELRPILQNDHFDFSYQQAVHLPEEIRLLPGDHVVVECTYNSSTLSSPTFGGDTAHDEMCLAYLTYYPLTGIHESLSLPYGPLLFGLTALDGYTQNMTKDELRRRLATVDWNKVNSSVMEAATRFSPHECYCRTDRGLIKDDMVTYPRNYEPYREKDECSQRKSTHGVSAGCDNRPFCAAFVFSCTVILYVWEN